MQTRQLKMVFEVTDRHTKYACHFALVRVMVVLAVVGAVINWPFVVVQYGVHALQGGGDFLAYTKKSVWKFQKNYKKALQKAVSCCCSALLVIDSQATHNPLQNKRRET